jgi:hypothetical protein
VVGVVSGLQEDDGAQPVDAHIVETLREIRAVISLVIDIRPAGTRNPALGSHIVITGSIIGGVNVVSKRWAFQRSRW